MSNYYQLLNLQPTASTAEVTAAYQRERARLSASNPEDLDQQIQAIEEAYAVLSDSGQRAAYDRSLNANSPSKSLVVAAQPAAIMAPAVSPVPLIQQECWNCGKPNPVVATNCAYCGSQLSRPCPQCGQSVALNQTVCPRCNTFLPEYDKRRFTEAIAVDKQVQEERYISETRVETLEAIHTTNRNAGVVFWLVVFALCVGLTLLAALLLGVFGQVFQ